MVNIMATFHRRRTRRVLKWGGLGLSLVFAMILVASRWWGVVYVRNGNPLSAGYSVAYGRIGIIVDDGPSSAAGVKFWQIAPEERRWDLHGQVFHNPSAGTGTALWVIEIPLWMLFFVAALPTACLWWRDRRLPPGHCQRCAYDLTGNTSGICPECGAVVPGMAVAASTSQTAKE
jgi:hypothetical protein